MPSIGPTDSDLNSNLRNDRGIDHNLAKDIDCTGFDFGIALGRN